MTALPGVRSTHWRSALPTVNHTRTVLQKLQGTLERPVPPAAVVTLSTQAAKVLQGEGQVSSAAELPAPNQQTWDSAPIQEPLPPERTPPGDSPPEPAGDNPPDSGKSPRPSVDGLTDEQREMVIELVQRDREVHAHEAAHQAAGGGLVGPASYTYQEGPDGRSYAIGGECPIVMPTSSSPSETIDVAQRVRAAALAPANPSAQDLAVASAAVQMEGQARQELAQQQAQQPQPAPASRSSQSQPAAKQRTSASEPANQTPPDVGNANRAVAAYARASVASF